MLAGRQGSKADPTVLVEIEQEQGSRITDFLLRGTSVSQQFPGHLRLHKEDHSEASAAPSSNSSDLVEQVLHAFCQATGWAAVATADPKQPRTRTRAPEYDPLHRQWSVVSALPMDGMLDALEMNSMPAVSESAAQTLLDGIAALIRRVDETERVVWRQEAELASNIGLSMKVDDQEELASKIDELLAQTASAMGCDAAAIYLLDDATSVLKMRGCIGLPKSRLAAPPRPLRGSLGDLEALLGNAVLIEDIASMPQWQSPEEFGSALVIPIGTLQMPQGTLWLWSERRKTFNANEVELGKRAAGELMSILERRILCKEVSSARQVNRAVDEIATRQATRLPDDQPLDRRIDIAGITESGDAVSTQFHAWTLRPDQQILACIGGAKTNGLDGCMVATTLQTTTQVLWHQALTATQLMRQTNDHLWGLGEGDWRSAMSLVEIDPASGQGCLCTAGRGISFLISTNGFRPLATSGPLLATQPEAVFSVERFTLEPRDVLLMFSPLPPKVVQQSAHEFNELLRTAHGLLSKPAKYAIDQLSRRWIELGLPYDVEKSIVWIARANPTPKKKPRPLAQTLSSGSDLKPRRTRKSR